MEVKKEEKKKITHGQVWSYGVGKVWKGGDRRKVDYEEGGFKKMECGLWSEGKKKEEVEEEEEWRQERGGWSNEKKRKMKCGIWKRGRKRN